MPGSSPSPTSGTSSSPSAPLAGRRRCGSIWPSTAWPQRAAFAGVFGYDETRFAAVELESDPRIDLHRRHDAIRTIAGKTYLTEIEPYLHWKGETCKMQGLSVLIDDMRDLVLPGCRRHGIDYLHPDEL